MGHQRPLIRSLPAWAQSEVLADTDFPPPALGALGREVIDLAALAGLYLDPWQAWIMEHAHVPDLTRSFWNPYTERHENKWAAFEVGIMVSRQNGKGSILEARELAGLYLFGEKLIVHSAHQFDTSMDHMRRILELIESTPEFDREVASVQRANGKEGITLKSGQCLRFRTRTKGGGRGFSSDCLVLDEAMYLGSQAVGALLPTLSARPNPQVWVTGSAGDEESTHFGRMRSRAMNGIADSRGYMRPDPKMFYAEWSIEPCTEFCTTYCDEGHDKPDTIESYAKSNPGLGVRLEVERIEVERRSMDAEMFLQERLGVGTWPVEDEQWKVIGKDAWEAREDVESELIAPVVLAVDTSPDRKYSCIAAAGLNEDGMTHVEITVGEDEAGELRYDHRPGTQWVVETIKDIHDLHKPVTVVIDKAGQAGSFILELEAAGITVVSPLAREYAQACGEFYSAVIPRKGETATLVHMDQPPLTAAVAGADKRDLTDMWAWSKRSSAVDITPLCAATLAAWGYRKYVNEPQTSPPWVYRR